jgi:ADP-ribose pyrophosphatase YjhB (NUDIX family)
MAREYPEHPIVGVAAVVLRGDYVLLVQRGREPARGLWGLPGGALELGEALVEGVRREVLEECGVTIEVGPLVGVFEPKQRDANGRLRFHYVVLDYLATYTGGALLAADDAADARWIRLAELDRLPMLAETRAIIHRAAQQRERQGAAFDSHLESETAGRPARP